ncbi:MAG: glutamine--fructose-6-phosphate transaminase (isomerizing) [Bacteroidales bacterium]|jgi:glucosamine--fructose-6-phosphate aminotransferase (isomerizing)|nr:glutamine--fructose-6-phosphate transaminase (isomerizing) [Bacteroidales bacterium]
MCGIVGYIGFRDAYPILIKGLHRLEYRGYDSAGCALVSQSATLNVYKAKGKVQDLETATQGKDISGSLGIAHTRWATHGAPSEVNAHPHVSQSGSITLVHNGIIENYATLRSQLEKRGFVFQSQTDTEVLVQLIEYQKNLRNCDLSEAVRRSLKLVIGAYAIAVIDKADPNRLVAARKASPLAIGIGEDHKEFFLASDASPIAEYTKQIVYLNDDEVAVIERDKDLHIMNLFGQDKEATVKEVDVDLSMLDKGGFPHFMLKEIFDQPNVLRDCMRGRIINNVYSSDSGQAHEPTLDVVLSAVKDHRRELLRARRIVIVSCGTSWHAGLIGKQLIEHFCRIPTEVAYASEFRYADPVIEPDDVVIAISQSGETADTLAAIQLAKENGAFVYGIVNAVGSSIARNTDTGTYIHVGPEIGVASTKAFTGQVVVLVLFALALGMYKGTVEQEEYQEVLEELTHIPDKIQEALKQNDKVKELSKLFADSPNFLYLGRGYNYPVALEGALKLKEISYIHAEGYPAAEMKHGPIALIDKNMPVVFLTNHHRRYQKVISNLQEVISRHGQILAIIHEGDDQVKRMVEKYIEVPQTISCLAPLISVIPLQLLSYHIAVARGLNVDQPRNLAKSVTVE